MILQLYQHTTVSVLIIHPIVYQVPVYQVYDTWYAAPGRYEIPVSALVTHSTRRKFYV